MQQYLNLVYDVYHHGKNVMDRTGVGRRRVFGTQSRYDLQDGFPLVTAKKTNFHAVKIETLWFLSGNTNIAFLKDNGVNIWNEWADENGDLGPVYGQMWRSWPDYRGDTIDQIKNVIHEIKTNPTSSRLIVNSWNVAEVPSMALPPCHTMFQFFVEDGVLSCQLYQRSADVFLGVPFNIAGYALLTHMIAHVCGLRVGEFIHTTGDTHLYLNHLDVAYKLLGRATHDLPELWLNPDVKDIDDFKPEDIEVIGYNYGPFIKAPVAV